MSTFMYIANIFWVEYFGKYVILNLLVNDPVYDGKFNITLPYECMSAAWSNSEMKLPIRVSLKQDDLSPVVFTKGWALKSAHSLYGQMPTMYQNCSGR